MSTFDYAGMQAKATALLERFGRAVTVRSATPGAYNLSSGQQAVTTADVPYKGALFDFGKGVTQVRGQLVQADDKRLLLQGGAGLTAKDTVLVGSVEYTVISVGEVNPAGTSVVFDAHVRR